MPETCASLSEAGEIAAKIMMSLAYLLTLNMKYFTLLDIGLRSNMRVYLNVIQYLRHFHPCHLFLFNVYLSFFKKERKPEDVVYTVIILNLLGQSQCRHMFNRMSGLPQALDCIVSFLLIFFFSFLGGARGGSKATI